MKCVVLCAGKGTRLGSGIPKVLTLINGRPLINHVMDMWKASVDEFIFVVGYRWQTVVEVLPHNAKRVFQEAQKGIADAILRTESLVADEEFVVILGDCVQKGTWELHSEPPEIGIGVWRTTNLGELNKNYLVEVSNDYKRVTKVVEKPNISTPHSQVLCGMGTYFLDKRIFSYIKETPISPLRNEVEITHTIQLMIDNKEPIFPFFFEGEYLNVTYQEDIEKAKALLR